MEEFLVPYADGEVQLEGFAAAPSKKKSPLLILCHPWKGRDEFICEKARLIASWGYSCFALDMYGKGVVGRSKEENAALKKPFIDDRKLLQRRVLKGFEAATRCFDGTDKIAVLGFGFGGVCALDLARSGVNLRGAISVYGHFGSPPASIVKPIRAKILILHGYNDPVTPQGELLQFQRELDAMKVDWQAHVYGNTLHAFASPGANDPGAGILYNSVAERRAWMSIHNFLSEVFSSYPMNPSG